MGTRLAGVVQGYRPQVDWGGDTGSATIVLRGHNVVKVGTAGWRRRCLYILLVALLILSIVNLSITLWILKTLSFSVNGMGALHVVWGGVHVEGTTELLGPVTAAGMGSRIGEDFHLQSYHNLTITTSTTDTRLTSPPPPPPTTITTTTSHNTTTARLTSPPIDTPAAASTSPHSSSSSLTSSSQIYINASSLTSNSPSSTSNSPSSASNSPSSTSNSHGSSPIVPQTSSSTTLISVLNSLIPNSSTSNTLTADQNSIPPTTSSSTVTKTSNSPTSDQVSSTTTTTTTPTTASFSSSSTITTPTSTPTPIPDLPLPTSPKTTTVGKKNMTGFLHINTKDVVAGGRSITVRSSEDGQELLYYSRNYSRVGAPWLNVTGARGAKISGSLQTPLLVSHGKHELRLESVTRELKARGSEVLMAAWSADIVGVSQGNVSLQSGQGRLRLNTPDLYFANLATETKRKEMTTTTTTTTTTTNTTPLPQETQIPAPDSEGVVGAGTTIPPTTPLTPTTKEEEEEEGKVEKEEKVEKERVQVFQVCVCKNGKLYLAAPEAPCPYFNYCR
ncbi:hypothetical protein Pmani_014095 [Petrolisthes manimaculis]|uniref:Uncharacterized protein n=1 Tax=Petrolisthes manimaculis TaxID=1843537 RepID=A0AAE1PW19_9EUCA|nr:hypothetical protein Pmani_014095 [Petrolisthes manimaculis]